jgi:thioredoxin reductase (NADPH)
MSGMRDLVVIGLGPAGVAAALQARRDGLDVLAIGDEPVGGLLPAARRIDNLPGHPRGISGRALARRLAAQVRAAGVAVERDLATAVERAGEAGFRVVTGGGRVHLARTVCIAPGTSPVPLPRGLVPDGVHVLRDVRGLERVPGSTVLVMGGGDAAIDSALSVADAGMRPVVVARRATRAAARLLAEAAARGILVRIGDADGRLDATTAIACIGREPRIELLTDLVPGGPPADIATPVPGLFVAGDAIRGRDRFVATAMGDGQRAAVLARAFIEGSRST